MATLNKTLLKALIADKVIPSATGFTESQRQYLPNAALTAQKIIDTIALSEDAVSPSFIASKSGITRNTVLQYVRALAEEGLLLAVPSQARNGRPEVFYKMNSGYVDQRSGIIKFLTLHLGRVTQAFDYPCEIDSKINTLRVQWSDHCLAISVNHGGTVKIDTIETLGDFEFTSESIQVSPFNAIGHIAGLCAINTVNWNGINAKTQTRQAP